MLFTVEQEDAKLCRGANNFFASKLHYKAKFQKVGNKNSLKA